MELPEIKGFSVRNLKYMRKFAKEYPDFKFVQEVLAQITWYHNIILMDKINDIEERKWYIKEIVQKYVKNANCKLLEDMPEYLQSQLARAEDIELHIKACFTSLTAKGNVPNASGLS